MSEVEVQEQRRRFAAGLDRIQAIAILAWLCFGVAVLIFGAPLSFLNRRGGPGSGFFLKSLACVLLVLVVLRAATLIRAAWTERGQGATRATAAGSGHPKVRAGNVFRCVALVAALLAYPMAAPTFGFTIATAALGWITLTLLGRPPIRSLAEAVIAALVIRFAFSIGLGVPLPETQFAILRSLGL